MSNNSRKEWREAASDLIDDTYSAAEQADRAKAALAVRMCGKAHGIKGNAIAVIEEQIARGLYTAAINGLLSAALANYRYRLGELHTEAKDSAARAGVTSNG